MQSKGKSKGKSKDRDRSKSTAVTVKAVGSIRKGLLERLQAEDCLEYQINT